MGCTTNSLKSYPTATYKVGLETDDVIPTPVPQTLSSSPFSTQIDAPFTTTQTPSPTIYETVNSNTSNGVFLFWVVIIGSIIGVCCFIVGLMYHFKRNQDHKPNPQFELDLVRNHDHKPNPQSELDLDTNTTPIIPKQSVAKADKVRDIPNFEPSDNFNQVHIQVDNPNFENPNPVVVERNSIKEYVRNYIDFLFQVYEKPQVDMEMNDIPTATLNQNQTVLHESQEGSDDYVSSPVLNDKLASNSSLLVTFKEFGSDSKIQDVKRPDISKRLSMASTERDIGPFNLRAVASSDTVHTDYAPKRPFPLQTLNLKSPLEIDELSMQSPLEEKIFTWMGEDDFSKSLNFHNQFVDLSINAIDSESTDSSETVKQRKPQTSIESDRQDIDRENSRNPVASHKGQEDVGQSTSRILKTQTSAAGIKNLASMESFKTCKTHFSLNSHLLKKSQSSIQTFYTAKSSWPRAMNNNEL